MPEDDELDENEEIPEEALPEEPPKYEDLVAEEPERQVTVESLEVPRGEAGEDGEDDVVKRTDLQAAMQAITPKFKDKRMDSLLQPVMVSRVFPDNYLDLNYLLVMSMIEEHEGEDDIDIVGIITGSQVATSKAYEGKHIIDILEIAGVAHEEEMERLSKEILGA